MKPGRGDAQEWTKAARAWVRFVRNGLNYYSEFLNGPVLKRMLGHLAGKTTLDIGCGEGFWSRWCAAAGARVTAIDRSVGLIGAAQDEEARRPLGIKYLVADAAKLDVLDSETFDIAFCFMAIMDIQDHEGTFSEVSRVLRPRGRFVMVLEHPCFTSGRSIDGKLVSGWETLPKAEGATDFLYYWIADYLRPHSYPCVWKHDRLKSSFVTTGYHRPLSDYIGALAKNGFVITDLEEPQPLKQGVKVHPSMSKHYRVPQSLAISTVKSG